MDVAASAGDRSEEEMTPYLNLSANACVRMDVWSEKNSERRDCIYCREKANEGNGKEIHICC